MNLNTLIQYYDGKTDNVGRALSIDVILQTITGPSLKPFDLRKVYAKLAEMKKTAPEAEETKTYQRKYDDVKGELPAVTWAGTFSKRSIKGLIEPTNLIVLDIDKLESDSFTNLRNLLCADPHTFICFTSPSGAGIKVVFMHDGKHSHNDVFKAIEKYMQEKYAVAIDKSGKDISRLCFLCYDPELFVHQKAKLFPMTVQQPAAAAKPLTKQQQTALQAMDEDLYSVIEFTNNFATYADGSRNNYVHLFACNANRKGFDSFSVESFAVAHFSDLPEKEIKDTVKSAYSHNVHEHGKFKKQAKNSAVKNSGNESKSGDRQSSTGMVAGGLSDSGRATKGGENLPANARQKQVNPNPENPMFWTKRMIKKGKGENQYEIPSYELRRVEFTDFLYNEGFHLLETDAGGYQICFSRDGVIAPVEPRHIKKHVFAWCKEHADRDIEEMLRKGQKQFFATNEMDALHTRKVELKTDTETESYYYFHNGWVTVTKDDIVLRPYSELDKFIWAGTKRDHEIVIQEPTILKDQHAPLDPKYFDCEFAKFVFYVSYNPNNPDEKDFDDETISLRFFSIVSAIGFMLDGYKHPADRKGIFAVDHKIGEQGEQNGRTGKSIIPKAIEKLKVVATISGKNFDPKYQFRYEPITMDSQVINFNDMPRGFDVESIFEVIADDYSVNRRNNGFLHFRYENSPKPWVSTNFTPRGAGDSYAARMHIIEFSDFFNAKHSPYDEFGHGMFSSAWDKDEWNRFYNFLLWCVQVYKTDGLVQYPKSNFEARKLANEVVAEFIDFMDSEKVPRNQRIKKHELLEEFNKEYQMLYSGKLKPHTFHKWVKQYCKHHNLHFNPHKHGSYDKSNGVEFYTIATTADFKPEITTQNEMFKPAAE